MTFEEALKILGLEPNYTDEELKTAWRKLSKEHHPDKHQDAAKMIEKQALINAARDFLKNYRGQRLRSTPKFDLSDYINQKIKEAEAIIKGSSSFDNELLKKAAEMIGRTIKGFKIDMLLAYNSTTTKEDIDKKFKKFKEVIKYQYESYLASFYVKYDIFEKDVKETINYDCSLLEFHNQLLKIKEKYSKEVITRKILEKEIEKYKEYAGYDRVATIIDVCKNNAIINIKKNNYQNIESEINKMHHQILTEVFETYYSIKKKIANLEQVVKLIPNEQIQQELIEIKKSFEQGQNFYDIEQSIKKLEEKINEIQKYKANEKKINEIYQSLIERYSVALSKINVINDLEKAQALSGIIAALLEYFVQGCKQFKGIEYFEQFKKITFENYEKDYKIIEKITKGDKIKRCNVYFKKKTARYVSTTDMASFYYYDEVINKIYKINGITVTEQSITPKMLEEEYISLEEYLDTSQFIGEFRILAESPVRYLYKDSERVLFYLNDEYYVLQTKWFELDAKPLNKTGTFKVFQDKAFICEQIKEQVKVKVISYREKMSKRKIAEQFIYGKEDNYYNNNKIINNIKEENIKNDYGNLGSQKRRK